MLLALSRLALWGGQAGYPSIFLERKARRNSKTGSKEEAGTEGRRLSVFTIWECKTRRTSEIQIALRAVRKKLESLDNSSASKILVKPPNLCKTSKPPINTGDKSFQNLA